MKGNAQRGNQLAFGSFGIKALEEHWITGRQIEAARQAVENDVHIVGVSTMTAGHLTLTPELRDALARVDRKDIMMVVGGVIPPDDFQALYDFGAAAIFPPGTNIPVAAEQLLHELNIRLGFAQGEVAKAG